MIFVKEFRQNRKGKQATSKGSMRVLAYEVPFVGVGYQGKDIVFGFIIEYSSLRDFGPY
jgi:hypothetical protein